MNYRRERLLNLSLFKESFKNSFKMLSPNVQIKNPVMFIVYIGAILTTFYNFIDIYKAAPSWFHIHIGFWLWITVLFANFAESVAESRGKAQAASLKKTQIDTFATQLKDGIRRKTPSVSLEEGDIILCKVNDIIPENMVKFLRGIATVDESAITGESAPVIRESGGVLSLSYCGTKIVSDQLKILVTSQQGESFLDLMIRLIEGAKRQKTPNEIALHIVLCGLTIAFLVTVCSLKFFVEYSIQGMLVPPFKIVSIPVLTALLVCLIPTTIGAF